MKVLHEKIIYTYNRKENSKNSWFTLSRKTVTK